MDGEGRPVYARGVEPKLGDLVVDVVRDRHGIRIVLTGELDRFTTARAALTIEHARERQPGEVVLDMSAVDFVDSHGIRLLADVHRRLTADGCRIAVVPPAPLVRHAFVEIGFGWLVRDREHDSGIREGSA